MSLHEDPDKMSDREFREFVKRRTSVIFVPEVEDPDSKEISGALRAVMYWIQYTDMDGNKKSIVMEDDSGAIAEIHKARVVPNSVRFHSKMFDSSASVFFKVEGADFWTCIAGPKNKIRTAFEFIGVPLG